MALALGIANSVGKSARSMNSSALMHEFKAAWDGGRAAAVEDYLDRLDPADSPGCRRAHLPRLLSGREQRIESRSRGLPCPFSAA